MNAYTLETRSKSLRAYIVTAPIGGVGWVLPGMIEARICKYSALAADFVVRQGTNSVRDMVGGASIGKRWWILKHHVQSSFVSPF